MYRPKLRVFLLLSLIIRVNDIIILLSIFALIASSKTTVVNCFNIIMFTFFINARKFCPHFNAINILIHVTPLIFISNNYKILFLMLNKKLFFLVSQIQEFAILGAGTA